MRMTYWLEIYTIKIMRETSVVKITEKGRKKW